MLERTAEPGETATFAFRVRTARATLTMRPFRAGAWASGDELVVRIGS
jgi:hypothetical protein